MNSFINSLTTSVLSNSRRPIKSDLNWLMLSNGAADLNDNVIFFGFEGHNAEPSFVAKVPRLPANGWIAQTEYDRLVDMWRLLGDDAPQRLPEPVAIFEVGKQRILIISYVHGEGLLFSAKKRLWHDPAQVLDLSLDVAHSLRELHDRAAVKLMDYEQVPSDFLQKVELFKNIYTPNEKELRALSELEKHFKNQSGKYKTLLQGDFWHGNIIRSSAQNALIFVDWQHSRWSRDVNLDVYLFLLAGALTVSQGSPEEISRSTVNVLIEWRQKIIPAYLAAYGKVDRFSLLPARYGMLLCCVEKAVRAVIDFGYNQSDDIIWRNLLTELINISSDGFFDGI